MSSIAALYGFADYQLIYGDGANAELRRLRPNPNVLYPGDRVFVPEVTPSKQDCAVDAKHRDRKSTRLNSSHGKLSRMPSSA